ncbi:hypothetical protein, partial [Gynuella sp.]|uniref:hypothetical protein n=1 Tax=Gynuella sp. TaxID=2969146 RepID=UPI003D0F4839
TPAGHSAPCNDKKTSLPERLVRYGIWSWWRMLVNLKMNFKFMDVLFYLFQIYGCPFLLVLFYLVSLVGVGYKRAYQKALWKGTGLQK